MHVIKAREGSGGTFRSFLLFNYAVRPLDCTGHSFLTSAFDGGDYSEIHTYTLVLIKNFVRISVLEFGTFLFETIIIWLIEKQ
jgi:hypothetical protein